MLRRNNAGTMTEHANQPDPARQAFAPLDEAQAQAHALLLQVGSALQHTQAAPAPAGWLGPLRRRWARTPPPAPGLYLWGGVGRGKTHLMDAFFEGAPVKRKRRLHFHHFMRDLHAQLADLPPQPDPLQVVAERLAAEVRLLCLDEFVVTDITDAMILHGLLAAMFAHGITLVTTSNIPPHQLYENGLQRDRFLPAIDLLAKHTREFNLDAGIDYRLRTLEQAEVYFTPLGGAAESALERLFEQLSGGRGRRDARLIINRRAIRTRRLAPGVAWLGFDELCEGPRATVDYIEIAREYHTVLVSGIPQLAPALDAAARRLLHLVDEFYDRNVKLIVSAAVPLEDLYQGKELAFEYERLRSRLIEMRAVNYLARPHIPL